MNNYRIQFKTSAAKEFKTLPPSVKQRVGESLDQLQQDPRPSGVVKLQGEDQLQSCWWCWLRSSSGCPGLSLCPAARLVHDRY